MKNVNSINELIEKFEDIVLEESNLIRNGSTVALKHVATGKYLSSIKSLYYTTGSTTQTVFAGSSGPVSNSLWKINFDKELATYGDNINLLHVKSNKFLGIHCYSYQHRGSRYCKSPSTDHTEVCCKTSCIDHNWKFNRSKLKNHRGYLKSNDIINISIKKTLENLNNQYEFLRSHEIQFTIGNDAFQEIICHNERLGGNDEWCIELINEVNL